ncbi:hypothetical protein MRB53_042323 [Persea americana]|nr:hypothetical protein MRB53_042323 [Persea americana]
MLERCADFYSVSDGLLRKLLGRQSMQASAEVRDDDVLALSGSGCSAEVLNAAIVKLVIAFCSVEELKSIHINECSSRVYLFRRVEAWKQDKEFVVKVSTSIIGGQHSSITSEYQYHIDYKSRHRKRLKLHLGGVRFRVSLDTSFRGFAAKAFISPRGNLRLDLSVRE